MGSPAKDTTSEKTLDERVKSLEDAAKEEDAKKLESHEFEFNTDDWNLKFWDIFAIVAVTKAVTLIKVELPPLLDVSKMLETLIEKKGRARGQWGWLFSKKGESPEEIAKNQIRILRTELDPKFTRQASRNESVDARTAALQRGLRGTNSRLQETQRNLRTYQRAIRRESAAVPGPSPSGSINDANRLRELESRVNGLVRVLGS
ncbi:hypothetical protein ACWIG4_19080 [Streptomyces sp. NPDC002248]